MMICVTTSPFDPSKELGRFEAAAEGSGAIVSFIGKVRLESKDGPVEALTIEHYPGLTERMIKDVCVDVNNKWPLDDVLIIHRIGRMKPGEAIVMVSTASAHRRAAFDAADYLMDFLKTKALFWKKETRGGKDHWIEPRAEDYDDAARWGADK